MQSRHLVSIVVIMMLFGSAYPVGKLGVDHFPPFAFATMRSALLAVALLPLWRLASVPVRQRLPLAGFCLAMGVGVYATMYWSLKLTPLVSPIVIGMQLSVPFAVLLGRFWLGERVRAATWAAIAGAFFGVTVIAFEPALLNHLGALGVTALSALCYAIATLCARFLRDLSPFTMNGWMAVAAIVPLGALSWTLEQGQWQAITTAQWSQWAVLLHSALAVSLLAHVWMFSLYRHYPVASVIPYYVLMPLFGIALSVVLFGEIPSPQTVVGGAIVLFAVWCVHRTTRGPVRETITTAAPEPTGAELAGEATDATDDPPPR